MSDDRPTQDSESLAPTEPDFDPRKATDSRQPSRGTLLGPYTLMQQLGVGGMGEVWEAEQKEPIRRRVAIKIIKRGMDTKRVTHRFEAERQALALMEHPSIARVLDAGETEEGLPYFVMELVRGVPINSFCDQRRLGLEARLLLMCRVCDAVQHAHQKAIIHRDLKPSNILVIEQDDEPLPKIIDFGVAKAIAQPLTERTLFTELGQLVGTPEYMSPEQADITHEDVDTRTDVYSLGVVLYELLAGVLPFDPKELRKAGFDGIRRILREREPSRPSTRVRQTSATSPETARTRGLEAETLVRELSGDLDWIVLKALEKERARRYGSPTELAADIRRHLANQPIEARPASSAYRMAKFARRHRVAVTVAAAALVLLLTFAGSMAWLARRLAAERDRANEETRVASAVSDFLGELFQSSDPEESRGGEITAREILDRGADRIRTELSGEPEIQARLMTEIGQVYGSLGLFEQADELLSDALELQQRVLGDDHEATLSTLNALGYVYFRQDRYDELEPLQERVYEGYRTLRGERDPDAVSAREGIALNLLHRADYEAALAIFDETLPIWEELLGADEDETRITRYNRAVTLQYLGRLQEAEEELRRVLKSDARLHGEMGRQTMTTRRTLGLILLDLERLDEAEPMLRNVLDGRRELLGPDHDGTLMSDQDMVAIAMAKGQLEEAERIASDLVTRRLRTSGIENSWTIGAIASRGDALFELGRLDEARSEYQRALEFTRRLQGDEHPETLQYEAAIAEVELAEGSTRAALERSTRVAEIAERVRPEALSTGHRLLTQGKALLLEGQSREAQEVLARSLAISERYPHQTHTLGYALTLHAEALWATGREEEAIERFAEGVAILESSPATPSRIRRETQERRQRLTP